MKSVVIAFLLLLPSTLLADMKGEVFGASMPADPAPVSLAAAIDRLEAGESLEGVKISGRITEVCQKKGCWMVLVDGDVFARVRFKDYGFFVPTDTASRQSVVLGSLTKKALSARQAAHYEKDAGRTSAGIEARSEYAILASSVFIAEAQ